MQVFMVTGLFAGQHNTKLHGTITGVILFFCSTFPPSSWDQTNTIDSWSIDLHYHELIPR